MQHDIAYDDDIGFLDAIVDDDDIGFLDAIVDGAKATIRYAGKATKAVAKAILPDDIVDFVADIAESAWDFGEDVIVKQVKDPKTWAVVGAAVATVATGGVAAPLAATVAAETLAAKAVTGIGDEAFRQMSSKAKAKLVEQLKRKNPKKWTAGVDRAKAQIVKDPRWEKARFKAEVAALSKAGIKVDKYGKIDTNPVYRDYRKAIDGGSSARDAMAAAKARADRIDKNRGALREQLDKKVEERSAREAVAQSEAANDTETKSGPPVALIAGGLVVATIAAVIIARRGKGRR